MCINVYTLPKRSIKLVSEAFCIAHSNSYISLYCVLYYDVSIGRGVYIYFFLGGGGHNSGFFGWQTGWQSCLCSYLPFRSMVESCHAVLISNIHVCPSFYHPSDSRYVATLSRRYQWMGHHSVSFACKRELKSCTNYTQRFQPCMPGLEL